MDRRNSIFLSDAQEKLLLFFIIHYYLFTESVYRVHIKKSSFVKIVLRTLYINFIPYKITQYQNFSLYTIFFRV